jgi:hypothetical protein
MRNYVWCAIRSSCLDIQLNVVEFFDLFIHSFNMQSNPIQSNTFSFHSMMITCHSCVGSKQRRGCPTLKVHQIHQGCNTISPTIRMRWHPAPAVTQTIQRSSIRRLSKRRWTTSPTYPMASCSSMDPKPWRADIPPPKMCLLPYSMGRKRRTKKEQHFVVEVAVEVDWWVQRHCRRQLPTKGVRN